MGGRDELAAHRIRNAQRAEARRVRDILARDKADAAAERFRREAEVEFEAGKSVMMADAVVPPTREQLATGEFRTYYPRQPDGSTREVKTVRRVPRSQARKMFLWGVIDYEGLATCNWYSAVYERTGLEGNPRGSDFTREVFMLPHQRERFTDDQIEYQDLFRRIRPLIRSRHLRLLDQVVLQNVAIHSAVRIARAFHRTPKQGFREAVEQLIAARHKLRDT
jgi:hypothetical protein